MLRTRCSCGCEHIIESDKPELFMRTRVCCMCQRHVMFRVAETPPVKEQQKTKADQPKKRGHPKKK